ncbi:hypothetical protein [Pseudoxanthomonas sp. UTMC 1351]|uniref:hypothetical protein n=1 Tax=Pseudoxanthomonas sp. UTMC 1351 TaxID=2695853 RepID=UPI0034CF489F
MNPKIVFAALLMTVAISAHAQSGSPGQNWGKLVGVNHSNAKACGATAAQLAAYKRKNMEQGKVLYGRMGDYPTDFEAGFKDAHARNDKALQANGGRPAADVCKDLLQQVAQP